MRTLTSVQSATLVNAALQFELSATDGGQNWTFPNADIVSITPLDWRVDFAGGLGKSSNYTITLQTSIAWIANNLSQIPNGLARLNITVNSDTFQSHSGRVRAIQRDAEKINSISLIIFDRFLNNDRSFPPSLSDSYSNLHPEVINENLGVPYYYGKQVRPYYHVAVDCDIRTLISPTTIDSSNGPVNVASIFYQSELRNGFETTEKSVSLLNNFSWNFTNNTITGSGPFEVSDISSLDARVWGYAGFSKLNAYSIYAETAGIPDSAGTIDVVSETYTEGLGDYWANIVPSSISAGILYDVDTRRENSNVLGVASLKYRGEFTNVSCTGSSFYSFGNLLSFQSLGNVIVADTHFILSSDSLWSEWWKTNGSYPLRALIHNVGVSSNVKYKSHGIFSVYLKSEAYNNYSIYTTQTNCAQSIISDNPIHIQTHIFSEYGIEFNQDQASATQLFLQNCGYSFNCYFSQRQPISEIIDDFGKQTNTYMWAADSGIVNFRYYQNSGITTTNATITTSDIISISIIDNPLGFSRFNAPKGSEYQMVYDYDFQTKKYKQNLYADKTNNSFCTSASNIGLTQRFDFKSEYIVETSVASLWLNKEIKKGTSAEEFVEVKLPARFFGLELTDVVRVQHPAIIGSESLYQITQISHDYLAGTVSFTGQELIDI